jgi:Fe-S cluster assembly ATP-binding protein
MKNMLEIKNLHASVEGNQILKGIDITIKPGEIHAIMGLNGSGKSTLANIISGSDNYDITKGKVHYNDKNLLDLSPEERALQGIFMSFQYPAVIPGVNNTYFLKAALNAKRKYQGKIELDAIDFMALIKDNLKMLEMDESYLRRSVNAGFSGGEKKRNEILQMITLEPKLAILDETDSGLDIDALKIIAKGVNNYRNADRAFLVITHYQRLLNYIEPDVIHVLIDGKIVKTGGKELALTLEEKGYQWLSDNSAKSAN